MEKQFKKLEFKGKSDTIDAKILAEQDIQSLIKEM